MSRPRIAVFAGQTATVLNTGPLVTSNKARQRYGLPLRRDPGGSVARYDVLRPQRLAAPVTVYVEQFSAHPLEADAADLYAPPDGYVDSQGRFSRTQTEVDATPVYEIVLEPGDGLYPLPFMGRQADGSAWEATYAFEGAPAEQTRQTFYPSAARLFEEIDRLGVSRRTGWGNLLASLADYDFFRPCPPGGYTRGAPEGEGSRRRDVEEVAGTDFFAYFPVHLRHDPPRDVLASLTNDVTRVLARGDYAGALWLEGSPTVEETMYWLNLVIDVDVPVVGVASQRPHGCIGNDGDRNVLAAVTYIVSQVWADESGRDTLGGVVVVDEQVLAARDVQKAEARPGGYVTTGGVGGPLGTVGDPGPPEIAVRPLRRHTHCSEVNIRRMPATVTGLRRAGTGTATVPVRLRDKARGELDPAALPAVDVVKFASYSALTSGDDLFTEPWTTGRVLGLLERSPLAGFVCEGLAPYGTANRPMDAAMRYAMYCGLPAVKVGRGNAGGRVPDDGDLFIRGNNLTATKARLLLMAALLRLGSLPPAADPSAPTEQEEQRIRDAAAAYQAIFDTH